MLNLFKSAAILMFTLLLSASVAMASGKMEVKIGENIELTADSKLASPQYKWVVLKGREILSTQTARNFSYQFTTQGEFVINLTATSGNDVEKTTVNVMAGDKYQRPDAIDTIIADDEYAAGSTPLILSLKTLPPMDSESRITLLGDGKVNFLLSESYGDIIEYRIDKNIYKDSDGNGVANDDIDNADHDSYLTGSLWATDYKKGETPKIAAEVTIVDKNGRKARKQVEIIFADRVTTGDPKAVLDVLPAPDPKDGLVHLYEDPHKVSFYARPSQGEILEYRIDTNIFVDSDGNGNPGDDIDNINDISFKTGDIFEFEYPKTDDQIIAQLIVVGSGGKGSRVQKGIVFGEKPKPEFPALGDAESAGGIRLVADKNYVIKGDPIKFTVRGLEFGKQNYNFEWDFDGDGETDIGTEGENSVDHIYETPGVFNVRVIITDKDGNSLEQTLEIISKDTQVTKADFSYEVADNTVQFTNLSTASYNLTDKQLIYNWNFGDTDEDGYQSQISQMYIENPAYTYNKAGRYIVTLTVTDADNVIDSRSAEVEIARDITVISDEHILDEKVKEKGTGGIVIKILKVMLYLILIVVILVLLIIGGFLAFFKVQHPDLTFEELVDELKAKILTIIGAHEMAPPKTETPQYSPPETISEEPALSDDDHSAEKTEDEIHPKVDPIPVETGPMPDWLKGTEVIEGESEPADTPEDEEAPQSEETYEESPYEVNSEDEDQDKDIAENEYNETEENPEYQDGVQPEYSEEGIPEEEVPNQEQPEETEGIPDKEDSYQETSDESQAGDINEIPADEVPYNEEAPSEETTAQTQYPAETPIGSTEGAQDQQVKKKKRRRRHKKKKPYAGGAPNQPQPPTPAP